MAMQPIADVAASLGNSFDAAKVQSIARESKLHIEVVEGVETVDLEAIRAILKLQAIEPRLDSLEQAAKGLVVNAPPSTNGWIIPAISALFAAMAAGGALWAANTASEQAAENTRALKATSGFAALEQFIDGLEAKAGGPDANKVLEIRLWLAKKMNDEGVVADGMWVGLLNELCPKGKDSDPEFLKTECASLGSNQTTTGQSQSGTVSNSGG